MSTFFSYLTLALAATSVLATPSRTILNARDGQSLNPSTDSIVTPVPATGDVTTNARRFSAGLPPVAPRARNHKARNPAPSGTPSQANGYIQVTDTVTNNVLGYLSAQTNTFGEYGLFETDLSKALKVSFDTAFSGSIDLLTSNSIFSTLPFLGAVQGFSSPTADLATGNANYLFLSPVAQTTALSSPVDGESGFKTTTAISKPIESAIWRYDAGSNKITIQWVNSDSSLPTTTLAYVPSEQGIVAIGDLAAFNSAYGVSVNAISFTFVSA